MNNPEYLKIYLDNIKIGLKSNKNIDVPDEFLDNLLNKYSSSDGNPNDIVEEINKEIESYIQKEVQERMEEIDEKTEEDKIEAENLAKEETEKLTGEEVALEDQKVKTLAMEEKVEKQEDAQVEEKVDEEIVNEHEKNNQEEKVDENEERKTQFNNADINMMLIAKAATPEELQEVISKIPNLKARLKDFDLNQDEFENTKRGLFTMYKDGLSIEERKHNGLAFETMEEYKLFADNLGDNFDTVVLENGKEATIDSTFNVKDVKDDTVLDNNKKDIEIPDSVSEFTGYVVEDDGNKHEQETRNVVKEQIKEENEMDIMFNDPEENNMTKEVDEKKDVKDGPKVLKLTPPSEKGFAYSPAINITIMLLLLAFFTIVLMTLL